MEPSPCQQPPKSYKKELSFNDAHFITPLIHSFICFGQHEYDIDRQSTHGMLTAVVMSLPLGNLKVIFLEEDVASLQLALQKEVAHILQNPLVWDIATDNGYPQGQ